MGFSDADLEKPIIGIANTFSELVPGSYNLRQVADAVRRGIYAAGGTPVEFGVIGACDGTAQGVIIDVIYYPGINEFRGDRSLEFTINDYRFKR